MSTASEILRNSGTVITPAQIDGTRTVIPVERVIAARTKAIADAKKIKTDGSQEIITMMQQLEFHRLKELMKENPESLNALAFLDMITQALGESRLSVDQAVELRGFLVENADSF